MQTLLLIGNGVLLAMVLTAAVKGTRVAYLTGLAQGKARGYAEGLSLGSSIGHDNTLEVLPTINRVSLSSEHLAS
jgi:hypothetical protein